MDLIVYIFFFALLQLFLIPLYNSFYLRLFSKFKLKYIKPLTILANLITPVIFTILFWNLSYKIISPSIRSKEFNTELWINKPSERYKMVNDLKNGKLIGKEKNTVLKMLGENDGNCASFFGTENTICYLTSDPENAFGIDHYELIIWFDNFNKVKRVSYEML